MRRAVEVRDETARRLGFSGLFSQVATLTGNDPSPWIDKPLPRIVGGNGWLMTSVQQWAGIWYGVLVRKDSGGLLDPMTRRNH